MPFLQLLVYDKGILQDPDEEIWRVRSGRVLGAGVSVLMELGCATLLAHGCVRQSGKSSNPILYGFLWWLHYVDKTEY